MAIPLTRFQEPGFFSQVQAVSSLFLLPGAVQVVALVGTGKADKPVLQEELTRAADADTHDTLANSISSISRVYSNAVFQYPISSYATSMLGTVAEGAGYNVDTKTLKLKVNDGAEQTVTFAGSDPISLASVITQLNAQLTDVDAVAESSKVKLISSLTGDGGKKIQITGGTALTALGFTSGAVAVEIDWAPSIASANPNIRPQEDDVYLVDYNTAKVAADFKPQFFFGQAAVLDQYGPATPDNTLSLGANGAFGNGAAVIVCRQLDPAQMVIDDAAIASEVDAALLDLEVIDCDIIVTMLTDTDLWGKYLTHVSKMSSKMERKERMALIGVDETSARIPVLGGGSYSELMAGLVPNSGLMPSRLMVMNPGMCKATLKGVQYTLDGTYIAACLAGAMVSPQYDTATPMTFKNLATIDELLSPELSRAEKNLLTSIGVTVVEPNGGQIRIRRAVTADISSIAAQEPSIVRAFDQVARQLRQALENRFVGTKITLGTPGEVASAVNTFLLNFVSQEIIAAFRNVQVKPNSVEPRQIDISFEALPIFPFLWGSLDITITLS